MEGTFSTALGATIITTCSFCMRGTYAAAMSTNCTSCPPNSNTTTSGATKRGDCACNLGAFGDLSNPASFCGTCPPNYYCGGQLQTQCPNGTLSFAGSNILSQCTCQTNATILPGLGLGCTCVRGFRSNANPQALGNFDCQPCTGGSNYCYLGVQYACPTNSHSGNLSSNLTDCVCDPGFYWNSTTSTCPPCPADSYCMSNIKSPCPDHTNSPAQSSLQSQCTCQGGYKCKLVRDYHLVVKFQLTQAQFDLQAATIRSQIAASAGVSESSVIFESSTPAASRRLLGQAHQDEYYYIQDDTHRVMHIDVFVPVNSATDHEMTMVLA